MSYLRSSDTLIKRSRQLFLACLLFANPTIAMADKLPDSDANGWHSWTIESTSSTTIFVRLKNGAPIEIGKHRCNSSNFQHWSKEPSDVENLGVVTADENFQWFRRFVEDRSSPRETRNNALFGIAQSDSAAAFRYLDKLISG